ncbi:MAG: hypothetical protein ABEH86_07805 [Haloarcula sp.]
MFTRLTVAESDGDVPISGGFDEGVPFADGDVVLELFGISAEFEGCWGIPLWAGSS